MLSLTARRALAALLLCLAGSGCGKRLDASECDALLDRYVQLLARGDRPDATASELLRLQHEAREKARRDPAFRQCSARVSRRSFECAMQAPDADRLEQCLL